MRELFLSQLALAILACHRARGGVIFGEPPSFTTELEDAFVFEVDAAGEPVTLRFDCQARGTPPPIITWFRSGEEDSTFVAANGSYIFPNITQQNSSYASGSGVEYYCTATNSFGTIRSRTVRAFYAFFAGFEARDSEVQVDVIEGRDVALECALTPGSTPTPAIQWLQCSVCDGSDDAVVVEDLEQNIVRFLDGGQYLLLVASADVIAMEYICQVTNKEKFQTERAPYTYTLSPVTSFPEGLRIYKPLENISAPLLSEDDGTTVLFSVVAAHQDPFVYTWLLDGSVRDPRLDSSGPLAEVTPILASTDPDTTSSMTVQARLSTTPPTTQTAYLLLQRPATITSAPNDMRDVLTGAEITFTCEVAGTPAPTITWYRNGEQFNTDSTVTISSATVEDSGMYQCFAENNIHTVYSSWTLQVRSPVAPSISVHFSGSVVDCLDFPLIQQDAPPVVLLVNLTADPCPAVQWYINDTLITSGTSDTQIIDPCGQYVLGDTEFSYQLIITALTAATTGFYRATFSNAGGEASVARTFVTPYFRGLIFSLQSIPYHPIDDLSGCLLAGSNVEIVCAHKAYPPAVVEFFKDGSPVDLSTSRVNKTCDTLKIFGVKEDDGGTYVCTVDNDDDPQASDTSSVTSLVYCTHPGIVGDLTFSKNSPEEGEATTATCTWTGDPPPFVQWFKDGKLLVESELPSHVRISPVSTGMGSKLEILEAELDDAGDYTCNVSNPVGFDFQVKRLEVQEDSTTALPTAPPPIDLYFINNTPELVGGSVSAEFAANRPGLEISCHVLRLDDVGFRQDCSNGTYSRTGIPPGDYTLRVVARDPVRGDRKVIRNRLWVHSDDANDPYCTTYLINRGWRVEGRNFTVEFTATGIASGFVCTLDRMERIDCTSPYTVFNLSPGVHHIKVSPAGCGRDYHFWSLKFTVV